MKHALVALALAWNAAQAQPLALPAPPDAGLEQHLGVRVPLDAHVTDDDGTPATLARFVDGTRPVILVPGYYRCAQLCGLVMQSLIEALHASGVPRSGWRIVGIGIDASEVPADAHRRHALDVAYADALFGADAPARRLDLHLLTLPSGDLSRVAGALGTRFQPARGEHAEPAIAHPATVVLVTPNGEIARYFNGVGIDPGELRVALADAAGNRIGGVTARIALLCAHFDPQVGRLDGTVMNVARALAAVLVLALGTWCWRRRGGNP